MNKLDITSPEFKNLDKWEKHALIYLNGVNAVDLYNTWDNIDHHTKIIYSEDFYNTIFKNSANVSDFITMEANYAKSNDGKKPTQDHFQVARIAIRALMEYNRPLLLDTEKFLDVCKTLRTVVRVTSDQNNEVKYSWKKKQIQIKELAIDKYDSYTWLNGLGRKVNSKQFPLKHLFYDWYTEFEKINLNLIIA